MGFEKLLNEALINMAKYSFDWAAIGKEAGKYQLMESTKIRTKGILAEMDFSKAVLAMVNLAKRMPGAALTRRELQRVFEALLRGETQFANDPQAAAAELQHLMQDQGVLQSMAVELKKQGVNFSA